MATSDEEKELAALKETFLAKVFAKEEIAKHKTEDDLWVLVHGGVYDMTPFQMDHPGGPDVLLDSAGEDGSEEFENILHTTKARKMGHKYLIGSLEGADFETWAAKMNSDQNKELSSESDSSQIGLFLLVLVIALVSAKYAELF